MDTKITEKVKTFEDACRIVGVYFKINKKDTPDEIAYKKLKIIAQALNEGWEPDRTDKNQWKFWPWFNFGPGSGGSCNGYDNWFAHSGVGSRLCFKSAELAEYAGTQFLSIYKDYLI